MLSKRNKTADLDVEAGPSSRNVASTLPFEPITLIFRNLRYYVPLPKGMPVPQTGQGSAPAAPASAKGPQLELLKGLTGYAAPGVLTALMGGSGVCLLCCLNLCCTADAWQAGGWRMTSMLSSAPGTRCCDSDSGRKAAVRQ